jgi:hypothetical protein
MELSEQLRVVHRKLPLLAEGQGAPTTSQRALTYCFFGTGINTLKRFSPVIG